MKKICSRYGYISRNGYLGRYRRWIALYRTHGEQAFYHKSHSSYSKEFITIVVKEYLEGVSSEQELTEKYKISCDSVLLCWGEIYNANRNPRDSLIFSN